MRIRDTNALLKPEMINETSYGLVDLTDMCMRWPLGAHKTISAGEVCRLGQAPDCKSIVKSMFVCRMHYMRNRIKKKIFRFRNSQV